MPEGTGIWLRCWEIGAHFCIHLCFGTEACLLLCILKQKRKLEIRVLERGRAAGQHSLLNRSKVHLSTIPMHSYSLPQCKLLMHCLCAGIDKPDKGHVAFVYFAKATVFVGCVVQSFRSFNGLRSEKLKCSVSARLSP